MTPSEFAAPENISHVKSIYMMALIWRLFFFNQIFGQYVGQNEAAIWKSDLEIWSD